MKNFSYTVLPVFMPIPTKFRLSRILGMGLSLSHGEAQKKRNEASASFLLLGDSLGARTQDPNIKSVVLYQLS